MFSRKKKPLSGAEFVGENSNGKMPISSNNASLSRKRWRNRANNMNLMHGYNEVLNKNAKKLMRNQTYANAAKRGEMNNTMMNLRRRENKTRRLNNTIGSINAGLSGINNRGTGKNYNRRKIIYSKIKANTVKARNNLRGKINRNLAKLNKNGYNQNYRNAWTQNFKKE